ncbi:MAG: STAS/SEC14 domain-containing protein [Sulfurimonas sp.]
MLNIKLNEKDLIVILEPDGALSEEDFVLARESIDPFIQKYGKLNGLIIYVKSFPGWDSFSALVKHLKFVNEHHKKVSHVAFVTNSFLGEVAQDIGSHFVNAKIKNFAFNELEDAKKWILSEELLINKHGLYIGIENIDDHFILSFKAVGTLTHEDYKVITPMIDSALRGIKHPNIKILVDLSEFEGWELRAAWDDFRIGLKYNFDFDKIAIYGNKKIWLEYGLKISSWFISGDVKEFTNAKEATEWLSTPPN